MHVIKPIDAPIGPTNWRHGEDTPMRCIAIQLRSVSAACLAV
jgi:hypothetical protein